MSVQAEFEAAFVLSYWSHLYGRSLNLCDMSIVNG